MEETSTERNSENYAMAGDGMAKNEWTELDCFMTSTASGIGVHSDVPADDSGASKNNLQTEGTTLATLQVPTKTRISYSQTR